MIYPVVIHKEKEADYGVSVPDLPGCFPAGETRSGFLLRAALEFIARHRAA